MGKKSTPKAPDLPDVNEMIDAQARANRVDTHSIMGGNTFSRNNDGTWTQRQEYSPLAKALLQSQMGNLLKAPMTFNSSRPQAVDQMFAKSAAKFGANGGLPTPQVQSGGSTQPNINQLIQQSLPETKEQLQQNRTLPIIPNGGFGGRFSRGMLP